jgi:hypothetical protein
VWLAAGEPAEAVEGCLLCVGEEDTSALPLVGSCCGRTEEIGGYEALDWERGV